MADEAKATRRARGVRARRAGAAPTIYDVAQRAGVNPSTVSRALSVPGRVSAPTEARIRQAARELDFRVNPIARALPTGRSNTMAIVVADITNPMVFGIVRGAEKAAAAVSYTLVIAESQESGAEEATTVERLLSAVDGIILATTRMTTEAIAELAQRKSIVLINREVPGVPRILPDVAAGVAAVITHLRDLGHRSICYLSGPPTSWISARRWDALLDGAERRGMTAVEVGPFSPTIDGGHAAYRRLVASGATAVVAFNDLIAIGVMQAAAGHGDRVPGRLSVVGFDDIFGADLMTPSLTTVRAPLQLAGELAARLLLAEIGVPSEPVANRPMTTQLIVRGSTGRPDGA